MPSSDVRCVFIAVHGIGNQKKDWSAALQAWLGASGQAVAHLVNWTKPAPDDIDVDNVDQGLDGPDHWRNPSVVHRYLELVTRGVT